MAMGLHGFFEGVAFGVANDLSLINMGIAIIAHKWSEALTVGISFVSAGIEDKKSIWFMVIFTLFTPFGIIFGAILSNASDNVQGIANAISAGTLPKNQRNYLSIQAI